MQSLTALLKYGEETLPIAALDLIVKATLILVVATLVARLLRRSSSSVRHAVWTSALLTLLVLPLFSRGLPRWEVPTPAGLFLTSARADSGERTASPAAQTQIVEETSIPLEATVSRNASDALDGIGVGSPETAKASAPMPSISVASIAIAVWSFGALAVLAGIAVGEVQTWWMRRGSSELENSAWKVSLAELIGEDRLIRHVRLLESSAICVPMTCGTLRPAIVIPRGFSSSPVERRRILLHELAHVRRFDVPLQTLGRLACAIYWFHPLAWWCLRQMHREREQACDDWVLRSETRPTDYANQLLALAKRNLARGTFPATVGIVRSGNLEKRIGAMLNSNCSHAAMGRACGALVLTVSVLLCAGVAVVHPQMAMAVNPDSTKSTSKPEHSAQWEESKSDPTKTDSYTVPIDITGLAIDERGEPIAGATIYISSKVVWKTDRIGEAITDDSGRYTLKNIELPIRRADTQSGQDIGGFIVFGTAEGHGFAWRPQKWYIPNPIPGNTYFEDSDDDHPAQFKQGERIELDLTFPQASSIRGTVVDADGNPVAKTKLAIWDAEVIPRDGYGPGQPDSDRRPFSVFDNNGFELLNAHVPTDMWITHSDAEGRFAFTGVPQDRRFRVKMQPPGFPSRMVWFTTQSGMEESYDGYRLYDASKDIRLTFDSTLEVPIQVVYGDSGEPAPKVFVSAYNKMASVSETTDKDGRVLLNLPPGDYELGIIREYGTPYLESESKLAIGDEAPSSPIVAKLPAAAQVEVVVIDKETGEGIANVDLWREELPGRRDLHYTTGWEVATRIVHRDRVRSDETGTINALFTPGKHRVGIALQTFPKGYKPVDPDGRVIECVAGEKQKVVFELERVGGD